jgi:hypothetical protein
MANVLFVVERPKSYPGLLPPTRNARRGSLTSVSESTTTSPTITDPITEGDHERMSHIVLEGVETDEGDFVSAGPSVVEGIVNATPVRALCGKVWVPGRDPKKYPLCPTCKDIAESMGWAVPAN